MTPTKQQTDQINSINPDILKLSEDIKNCSMKFEKLCSKEFPCKDCLEDTGKLSGILSQCKSELEFLNSNEFGEWYCEDCDEWKNCQIIDHSKVLYKKEYVEERISALKEAIKYMEGILK